MGASERTTVAREVRVALGPDPDDVACLEGLTGSVRGRVFPLTTGATLIGRGSSSNLRLEDDGISRQHAKIAVHDDGIVNLLDLRSTNGTFVNGAPIDVAIVRPGDRIQVGPEVSLRFTYRRRDDLAAAPAVVPGPPVSTLRPRERDVAALVAEGMTSNDIAARLGISPRTVTTHLRNIYERLQISSRAALARYAVQHGLLGRDVD
ncbi:MAG: LuxR C-terminal-related transcriptional regulator [Myxococcota bacterium]